MSMLLRHLLCCCCLTVLAGGLQVAALAAPRDADCLLCHEDKELASTNAAGKVKRLYVDTALLKSSAHKTNTCASCHTDISDKHPDDNVAAKKVNCTLCHEAQSRTYGDSVHGVAAKAGDAGAATCQDCHDSHQVLPPSERASPLHFSNLTKTCGVCHDKEAADVAASVHGSGVARGEREAATCIDCHSEHQIEKLKGASAIKISEQVCSKCHLSEKINTKFRLPKDRVQTFFESYHGLASQYGSTRAANCASCHGYHLVLPSTDSRSMIHTNNLVKTCGECHPGATANFVSGKIHTNGEALAGDLGSQINVWVRRIYMFLIVGTIGFMLAHNGLLWLKKFLRYLHSVDRPVVRMDANQRWQHFILVASFILLAWSGFALKFPDVWISKTLGSNEEIRRWLHRIAGLVLMGAGVYHVFYLAMAAKGRQLLKDFLPLKKDAVDLLETAGYLIGKRPHHARIGRFGYAEKMEYWAVVWGTIIMGATGLLIWFPVESTRWLPGWVITVATTIHYYEAILACLAIIVWHFYHVMFDPDVYPLNTACLDGRVTAEWMRHEHPLDPDTPAAGEAEAKPGLTKS
jgi:formate dehydrogenase gamma subunit